MNQAHLGNKETLDLTCVFSLHVDVEGWDVEGGDKHEQVICW